MVTVFFYISCLFFFGSCGHFTMGTKHSENEGRCWYYQPTEKPLSAEARSHAAWWLITVLLHPSIHPRMLRGWSYTIHQLLKTLLSPLHKTFSLINRQLFSRRAMELLASSSRRSPACSCTAAPALLSPYRLRVHAAASPSSSASLLHPVRNPNFRRGRCTFIQLLA